MTRAPEKRTAAEEVYRALKRDIITLQHQPGASLTEQQLATQYGTSRVPVREACRRLDQEGLLQGQPYRGYSVNQISLKEIGDCFDLRLGLETHALELAASRATAEDIQRLRDAIDQLPEKQRMVVTLVAVHGMDASQAADSLGITASNVGVLLYRAKDSLRSLLRKKKAGISDIDDGGGS